MRTASAHKCGNPWLQCTVCRGRLHHPDCATVLNKRLRKEIDCCEARHRMLFEQGQTCGLDDSSVPMIEGGNA